MLCTLPFDNLMTTIETMEERCRRSGSGSVLLNRDRLVLFVGRALSESGRDRIGSL